MEARISDALETIGAELIPAVIAPELRESLVEMLSQDGNVKPGIRLLGRSDLTAALGPDGPVGRLAGSRLTGQVRPVRAVLFDKRPDMNWSLGWHQDRVIAVKARHDVPGFGPWTRKCGALHVAPPFEVLAGMITLRVHLDDTPHDNAPLLVAPGSHRQGRIAEANIAELVARCGVIACCASAGDVWAYATPILHASAASRTPGRRRVLQVDYAAADLPGGLEWLEI